MVAALLLSTLLVGASANVFDFHRAYIANFIQGRPNKATTTAEQCAVYECGTLPAGECVSYDQTNGNYDLQACTGTQFCNVALDTQADAECLPSDPTPSSFGNPGDACTVNSDCQGLAQNCTKGICYGFPVDHTCSDQPDCGLGLMCENAGTNGTCQYQVKTGGACLTWVYDENCINGDVCDNDICVGMFSQPIGAIVSSDYGLLSCSSGFYESFPGYTSRGICAPAPKSPVSMLPIQCEPGSQCYSADGRYSAPCQCGINPNGNAYCPVFPGDDLYQNYLNLMKQYVSQSVPGACHYLDYGQEACGAPQSLFSALNVAKVTVDMQVQIQDNTPCIQQTFTQAYWSLVQEDAEELALY